MTIIQAQVDNQLIDATLDAGIIFRHIHILSRRMQNNDRVYYHSRIIEHLSEIMITDNPYTTTKRMLNLLKLVDQADRDQMHSILGLTIRNVEAADEAPL